ncbi:MAG: prepilin-type N-terminal cleavage/methylation domain-containing protein [Caldiserica bacterium]|nr:prepilin-type N-terminal cleavage/methylation domain-containing protein [Caldisericota bacterium]
MNFRKRKIQSLPSSNRRGGFTLIELIIVVAIIVTISGISVPYLRGFIISERLQAVSWQLVQDLKTVKEDAILYQQDLKVYFCTDPAENRNFYLFETFLKNPLTLTHYNPGDTPDGKHFIRRDLDYKIQFDVHKPFTSYGTVNLKEYYYVTFYCGKDYHFRGQPSAIDTIELVDTSSGKKFYVIVDLAGRIRMSGTHP